MKTMLTRRFALLLLFVPLIARGQVTLDQVTEGTMLLKSAQPGVYVAAPTVATDVKVQVRGLILRGEVTQRFRNPESTCAEAIYAFPLPETAAVDRLRMTVGMRVIEGEIRKREEAKQVYEKAKSEGKKATLVEQQRPNLFTASIANVGAGEEVSVTIDYQQTVEYRDGVFRLRYPMPPRSPEKSALPKETIFIIDTSGSMGGPSIDEAKRALTLALSKLSPRDRFNVIEFNSVTHVLWDDAHDATPDAVESAKQWVDH